MCVILGFDVAHNIIILSLNPTAKEHVRAQQYAKGSRQWNQEEEEDQVRFDTRNGPQVFEKPKICQKVQSFQA
jgi:hypothetical protein